jgi:hypothetical protein
MYFLFLFFCRMNTKKTIRLPKNISPFLEKTLLMSLEGDKANVYLGEGDSITLQEPISTEATEYQYSDKEGFNARGGTGFTSGGEHHDKEHYRSVFLNHLTKKIHSLHKKGRFQRLAVFAPRQIKNLLKEKMPPDVLKNMVFVSGNVAKESPLELVQRMNTK